MLKKHLYTILFISWVVVITLLSLFSFPDLDHDNGIEIPHIDKITHFTFYFIFVVLGVLFLKEVKKERFQLKRAIIVMLGIAFLYGIAIEILQYVMPYDRAAEILDVLANTMGAIFGGLLIKKYLSLDRMLK